MNKRELNRIENQEIFFEVIDKYQQKPRKKQIENGNFEIYKEIYFVSKDFKEIKDSHFIIKMKETLFPFNKKEWMIESLKKKHFDQVREEEQEDNDETDDSESLYNLMSEDDTTEESDEEEGKEEKKKNQVCDEDEKEKKENEQENQIQEDHEDEEEQGEKEVKKSEEEKEEEKEEKKGEDKGENNEFEEEENEENEESIEEKTILMIEDLLMENEECFKEELKKRYSLTIPKHTISFDVLKVFDDQNKEKFIEESRCIEFPIYECYSTLSDSPKKREKLIAFLIKNKFLSKRFPSEIGLDRCGKWKSNTISLANLFFEKINKHLINKHLSQFQNDDQEEEKGNNKRKIDVFARVNGEEVGLGDYFISNFEIDIERSKETFCSLHLLSPFFQLIEFEFSKILKKKQKNDFPSSLSSPSPLPSYFVQNTDQENKENLNKNKENLNENKEKVQILNENSHPKKESTCNNETKRFFETKTVPEYDCFEECFDFEKEKDEKVKLVLLLKEKEMKEIKGCFIKKPLLIVEGTEKERAIQFFPFCEYLIFHPKKKIERYAQLIEKSASLGHPIAIECYFLEYLCEYKFYLGELELNKYLFQALKNDRIDYPDFEKGVLLKRFNQHELYSKYFEKDSSLLSRYFLYISYPFDGKKVKELGPYFAEARSDEECYELKSAKKLNSCSSMDDFYLEIRHQIGCNKYSKRQVIELLVKSFLLGSYQSAYFLIKDFDLDPYFLEKTVGPIEIKEENSFPQFPTLNFEGVIIKKYIKSNRSSFSSRGSSRRRRRKPIYHLSNLIDFQERILKEIKL